MTFPFILVPREFIFPQLKRKTALWLQMTFLNSFGSLFLQGKKKYPNFRDLSRLAVVLGKYVLRA